MFSLGGWPFASYGLALVGTFVALSAIAPSPRMFVAGAVVAIPTAALLAGVTEFLILDGVDQFPLLAIGMAPSVLGAALLFTLPNARISSIGFLVLVYFPILLLPANPQDYNPETYLYRSFLATTAVILVLAVLWTILPTSDDLRRRWYLTSARAELRDLLAGRRSRRIPDDSLFRDADRIGQLAALQPADGDERRDDLRQALSIFGLAAAARRIQTVLGQLSGRTDAHLLGDGYAALADCNAPRLREAAAALAASTATQLDHDDEAAARTATVDLNWAAFVIDANPFSFVPTGRSAHDAQLP
jgi:Fusaric acid resistance protein family